MKTTRLGTGLALALVLAGLVTTARGAGTPQLSTSYGAVWCADIPSPAYSNYYSEGVGLVSFSASYATNRWVDSSGTTNLTSYTTAGGKLRLECAAFGQPVESQVAQYALGDAIAPPEGAATNLPPAGFVPVRVGNNTNAFWRNENGSAIWLPSLCTLVAAAGGNLEVQWQNVTGTVVYTISSIPSTRPARVYWTEPPYDAPEVYLKANNSPIYATLHYNNYISPPTHVIVTNFDASGTNVARIVTNLTKSIWMDGEDTAKCLRATETEGILLLEYYADGNYQQSLGVQPVQVLPPTIDVIHVNLGERLLPNDRYYGTDDLYPTIKAGISGGGDDKLYLLDENSGYAKKKNWLYSIRSTRETEWDTEVYWYHQDARGVEWPFEVDWYSIDWPLDAIRVVCDSTTNATSTLLPGGISVEIISQATIEEPKRESTHATLSSDASRFSFTTPGLALLRYSSSSDFWFEAVQGVLHDDETEYDTTRVLWPIGKEMLPFSDVNHVLQFDGEKDYAEGTVSSITASGQVFTVEAWTFRQNRISGHEAPVVSHYTGPDDSDPSAWELGFDESGAAIFRTQNSTARYEFPTNGGLGVWHHLAGVLDGTAKLYVDGVLCATGGLGSSDLPRLNRRPLQIGRSLHSGDFFLGRIDEVRLWKQACTAEQIASNMLVSFTVAQTNLLECYPMDEGRGSYLRDTVDASYATIYGNPKWVASFHLADNSQLTSIAEFPGFVYSGTAYNLGRYHYPTAWAESYASWLFGVNTNAMEVWWSRPSRQTNMPFAIHYPSLVLQYQTFWASNRIPDIVIASGRGSDTNSLSSPVVYVQNDPTLPGYNPNEEHAVVMGNKVYALRDDLNAPGGASEPFVLLDTVSASGRPTMDVFHVVRTNATYGFRYATQAGAAITPPMPLAAWAGCSKTALSWGPGWRDRKTSWWAKAAGDDGSATNAAMRFHYIMQPGFFFPQRTSQPAVGTELPWLPTTYTDSGAGGTPTNVLYDITWPPNIPPMQVAQTLTTASGGLPAVWDQASVDIIYEQSLTNGAGHSVVLYDPLVEHSADLPRSVVDELVALKSATKELTSARYRFGNISPALEERLFYDPTRGSDGQIVLEGLLHAPLTGAPYLLPNWLTAEEKAALVALGNTLSANAKTPWMAAINKLPLNTPTVIHSDDAYVNAALSAAAASNAAAVGYVTLAFNNSTNSARVSPGLPISLQVIRVTTNLFSAQYLDVIQPDNALEEKLSLRYPDDLGGHSEAYEFEWRWNNPAAGSEPSTPKETWPAFYTSSASSSSNGAMGITIEGGTAQGTAFMLSDHYFAVRYRRADGSGPSSTNWSQWVSSLAPGWIQRVLTAINPYEQRFQDMTKYAPKLSLSLIEQCGAPYEGPVALDAAAEDSEGLIQIYQTVLDRALSLTLRAGFVDSNTDDSLLFAATRLCNLYMILGNEAYADAQDPTISIDANTGDWYANYTGVDSSLFCFQNQMPDLLHEELALLRGRDDSFAPSVTVTPVFNRLIWNFTHGIDGGEVAYATSYDITGDPTNTTGVISVADAKRMYPQGHGDAWGHYLSALSPYYALLSYTNFGWNTIPGATLVGNATVGVDYFDEEEFAIAAAAKARTGADIVSLTARRDYVFGATGLDRYPVDPDSFRAWDTTGWAARAGQGAFFDWAVANSLLIDTVTNLSQVGGDDQVASGLNVIDRSTTDEISSIAFYLRDIQNHIDRYDLGLNPLGLREDAIPFDLSAAELDAGKTHFEQVYDRALTALRNAKTTFSVAQGCTDALRAQYDSAASSVAVAEEEDIAFRDRLIELYGYPYADDIGVNGSYQQGYDGPDLLNYMVVDLDQTLGAPPVQHLALTTKVFNISVDGVSSALYGVKTNGISTNNILTVTNTFNALGLRVKPASWTGRRRAQGRIQAALYDFAEAYYTYVKAVQEYNNTMATLQTKYDVFLANANVKNEGVDILGKVSEKRQYINNVNAGVGFFADMAALYAEMQNNVTAGVAKAMPCVILTVFGGASTKAAESGINVGGTIAWGITSVAAKVLEYAKEADGLVNENRITAMETQAATNAALTEIRVSALELLDTMADQYTAIDEINIKLTAMDAALQDVLTLTAEGERLVAERARARNRAAQAVQQNLYADMLYRTVRNESLAKYSATFDIATRYAYLAAMAYDYETGLLDASSSSAASSFLSGIVRTRLLGKVIDGLPQIASDSTEGDGGLSDILARLGADWQAVKARYGINNPDSASTRFSLRKELFRISSSTASAENWRNALASCRVDDLNSIPAYTKFCVPYSASTNAEPGLVIPFSSEIIAGNNFFGRPAGGGDNFFDPTWLSTRIRSAGVWFSGYNTSFNTNTASGAGLVNTPGVYLVPAGIDTVINGADRSRLSRRSWTVYDQVLPLPHDISAAEASAPGWMPFFDSLSGSFSDRRRHSSFRAHHDSGTFSDDELCSNARLVGRSVWNSQWLLIIPGRSLLSDPDEGLDRFIYGAKKSDGSRDGYGITDIRLYFKTYSYSGD